MAPLGEVGDRDFVVEESRPFGIGMPDAAGGAPVRRRSTRVQCNCNNKITFEKVCSAECSEVVEGATRVEIDLEEYVMAGLEPGSTHQYFLGTREEPSDPYGRVPDFYVAETCASCASAGSPPGSRYPALHTDPDTGALKRIAGWDSRMPIFNVLEHPEACNLVPEEETIAIGEWNFLASTRYSDSCDFVMQCMYEENSQLAASKEYWFKPLNDDTVFWISFRPLPVAKITSGFCFPDLEANGDADYQRQRAEECNGMEYFMEVNELFLNEAFMFVQADTSVTGQGSFPLRLQLAIDYWQKEDDGIFKKELVKARLLLRDFHQPEVTLRGHEYDLRITFVPLNWLGVLDGFALSLSTYLLFYTMLDFMLILSTLVLWGIFRGSTKMTNPPRLHFWAWIKGFELNPGCGFLMIVVPIMLACVFIRMVMGDIDPFSMIIGDMKHTGVIDQDTVMRWRHGRVGICILALGFFLMQDGAQLLCPRKDMPGSIWLPGYWQRRHVMYTSVFLFVVLLLALEFSFSALFKLYPLYFMLAFKVVWMAMEAWLLKALTEKLIALPFECALQTVQYVMVRCHARTRFARLLFWQPCLNAMHRITCSVCGRRLARTASSHSSLRICSRWW